MGDGAPSSGRWQRDPRSRLTYLQTSRRSEYSGATTAMAASTSASMQAGALRIPGLLSGLWCCSKETATAALSTSKALEFREEQELPRAGSDRRWKGRWLSD
mmetsp:Transcript_70402/g.139672  ORF Transcript_70402/g.139672 Transcript_70402/m.139672 type:complete len:102 (+) Transcript_70402:45-350(+)